MTAAIVTTQARPDFSIEQRQMIRDMYANGASELEFAVMMEIARARNLNPLLRQIHFVHRYDRERNCKVWTAQVSIDGLRAIAERTGLYDGQDEAEYQYDDQGGLICARVRVYRKDWSRPAVGVAYFREYAQRTREGNLTAFWGGKPHVMLAKCAEAAGLRRAFPEDTSGLYVPEEMGEDAARPLAPVDEPKQLLPRAPSADEVRQRIVGAANIEELRLAGQMIAQYKADLFEELPSLRRAYDFRKKELKSTRAA